MINENINGVALLLRELAGDVSEPVWERLRCAVRVLDQAAEDAKNLETGMAMCAIAIGSTVGAMMPAERVTQ